MNKTTKNIVVILGIVSTVFVLYYILTQGSVVSLETTSEDRQLQELVVAAETFAERQRALNEIQLNTNIFDDDAFQSLRSFSTPVRQYTAGRDNPFLPVNEGVLVADPEGE